MKTLKNLSRVSKIKAPLQQRLFPFSGVELDDHGLNVTTKIIGVTDNSKKPRAETDGFTAAHPETVVQET